MRGGVGGCGAGAHRSGPAVATLVVAESRDRVAPLGTCGGFVGPSLPVRRALSRCSATVSAISTQLSSPSCAAVSGGFHRRFPLHLGVTSRARCGGGSCRTAIDHSGVTQFPRRVAPSRLLCIALRRARLSACHHHGACRCVLVATMRTVAGAA